MIFSKMLDVHKNQEKNGQNKNIADRISKIKRTDNLQERMKKLSQFL